MRILAVDNTHLLNQVQDRLSALLGVTVGLEALLFGIALIAACAFLIALRRKRLLERDFALRQRRVVLELLNAAVDQRSVMELEFHAEDMHGRLLSGPCSQVGENFLTVDVGLEYSVHSWTGETVEVSFKLAYKGSPAFYRFTSRVITMQPGPRAVSIKLELPLFIQPMQKRNYVRVIPLPSHLLGMGLWSLDPAKPLPLDSTGLGRAAVSYRPGKLTQCSLLNLSAGGMRVAVPQAFLQQFPSELKLQSHILCLLLLRAPDSEQPLPFWLACTVLSLVEDQSDTSVIIVGLKFRAWALSETGSSGIFWFPTGKAGEVSPLASWVLRHQLEQSKLRG